MFRYIITIVTVFLFGGTCFAQVPTAFSTAEKFIEAQKKADEDVPDEDTVAKAEVTAAKIEAATLMSLNALMSAKDFRNALDVLQVEVDELAMKPDGKEVPVVKYDIIMRQIDEIDKVYTSRDMTGSLKVFLDELVKTFDHVSVDIKFREVAIDRAEKLQANVSNMVDNRNKFLRELQRLEKEGKLSADFVPNSLRITPPEGAVVVTSETVEAEIRKANDELGNAINSEISRLVEKGNELVASIENVGRLDEWANLMFITLCIAKAHEAEFQNTLLKVLSSSSEEKIIDDKLTFLYAYYTGLVKERVALTEPDDERRVSLMDESRQAFSRAKSVASGRQDSIRATSKLVEMRTLLAEK